MLSRLALAGGLALALSACSADLAPMGIPLGTVTLSTPQNDPGGVIIERGAEIAALTYAAQRGADVEKRITGECHSACTMYLSPALAEAGAVCFERDAVLGFHGPAYLDRSISEDERMVGAMLMARYYPPALRAWFMDGPAKGDELALVQAADLIDAGLARGCEG